MKYYIVMPVFNEAKYVLNTLNSIVLQSVLPHKVVVVDDNSTDDTVALVTDFMAKYPFIKLVRSVSEPNHRPGAKVINAFLQGLKHLDQEYDFIVKLDGDLILPSDYFSTIINIFEQYPKVGIAGGRAYIEHKERWVLESLTDNDHVRGAFKSYRKDCFRAIGGLQPYMGWDTVDEFLARFYQWDVFVDKSLVVRHLKPTGALYNKEVAYRQGEAFYRLGYGFWISCIASVKLAYNKRKPSLFVGYMTGFCKAWQQNSDKMVTAEQANFIQKYRWKKIRQKIFSK
ncbi:MAG: glycosyltransferase family 2 protein [Bacteroidota bacterium]|nr:glycosyltransferase family 2 protein [Bacteroidota bacterium]